VPPSTPPIGLWPSAAGLGPNDENILRVPEALAQLVLTRQQWVDNVGGVFEAMEREQPSRIYGLPERSIYKGLATDIAAVWERMDGSDANIGPPDGAVKGKACAIGEETMDIDR
jgi:transcriptional adapter 3